MQIKHENHPVLTPGEEIRLSRRIERGDLGAKEKMVESNLRLVHFVVEEYRGLGVPLEDLLQKGTVGLVRAVETFDHRRQLKFSTYAVWWIRGVVVEALGQARNP
jgi:RNA polymerase primary sigma factor